MAIEIPQPCYQQWKLHLKRARSGESKPKILAKAIRADIEQGLLQHGLRLPPQRHLADSLSISLQTISNAYQELERQGFIRCETGRGSFVSRPISANVEDVILDKPQSCGTDFSNVRIIHTHKHERLWRDTCLALSNEHHQPWIHAFRPIAGLETHREAAKLWLSRHGVGTELDDILITNGAAQGLFLALASLASINDVVLSEGVTDHGIIGISQVLGFTLKGLETDQHGIDPEHFEYMCSNERVTALICTPNFNNPTTTLMPDSRRREIAKIARHFGVWVIEDDVFGPLVGEHHTPPISHYLPELSFYCTSMTKSVLTGLRIGYLVMPKKLASRTKSILRVNGLMGTPIMAEIASRWISDGSADALIQVQRTLLSERQAVISEYFSDYILGQHHYALSAWIRVPAHWELDSLIRTLRKRNIAITPSDPFTVPGVARPQAVRVCVGAECSLDEMRASIGIMREVFDLPSFS
ncbi:PLP-dependent aminotransferase family protein [Pseudomonas migulae]|uniref:DNA-binding transcriptional regulator, MocR family, contains an aminotransferase domain n=1 Tax=Pseudomonas migulae TaxID=78543 RepID=A0A1H5H8I9_9PSED|nr:PLP-dependent aminotransferase family protein [Pseudomonas migulae]SEE24316.1 DNA-binding transcriptional regulator, MocR family, contains an aminotransferase domain [Pseudomonas migulae]